MLCNCKHIRRDLGWGHLSVLPPLKKKIHWHFWSLAGAICLHLVRGTGAALHRGQAVGEGAPAASVREGGGLGGDGTRRDEKRQGSLAMRFVSGATLRAVDNL